ncbi:hypothetical protein M2132_002320 [Dysgonomonas sp. PH5-45]|uniref:DUF4932 domain-containing protein n=1 Tax=unclassified Dysgonomonas TaxID=2630389 RepID=UPI00247434DD|nr:MULTISPECIES: DUF4932 domain-containing protein [unclassified Dysgonomonas]MDH6355969.1 hypothetical protein [Dysgonomonas sp. PH5-45]MDH6388864.1 hypothetical protein [Dysgonomonas sp. PH5-37]
MHNRKIFLLIVILLLGKATALAQWKSSVDPRVELTSIVFRYAGCHEYVNNQFKAYVEDADKHFKPFEFHPAVNYVREIYRENLVGYGAVADAAYHLKITKKGIGIDPDKISRSDLDSRWTKDSFEKFVKLLNDFYRDTNFQKFYDSHKEIYAAVEGRMDEFLNTIDTTWVENIFGVKFNRPDVYLGMLNGYHNYSSTDNAAGQFLVIGCVPEHDGLPDFTNYPISSTVIHELLHGFTTSLIDKNWDRMEVYANTIYEHGNIKKVMARNAYQGAKVMMYEWMNNLMTYFYFFDNYTPEERRVYAHLVTNYHTRGFIWMKRSINFMNNFYVNRELYPHLKDFMPQLTEFLRYTAENMNLVQFEYDNRTPYVVNVFPVQGSTIPCDMNLTQIRISFSEPMNVHSRGLHPIEDYAGNKDERYTLPTIDTNLDFANRSYWEDNCTFVIKIEPNSLEPNSQYGISLSRNFFQSKEFYPIKESYNIIFKTSEK